jgi:anti-sigma factor RsiW
MITDNQFSEHSQAEPTRDSPDGKAQYTNESTGIIDMMKRDRFELLSAYLDGEVTAAERRQVEEWLLTDASIQCLYTRLKKLRHNFQSLPTPTVSPSSEVICQQVFTRVNRRLRLLWLCGTIAIAVGAIGAISSLLPSNESRNWQIAQEKPVVAPPVITKPEVPTSPLMVALNNPVIEIPKTAIATPKKAENQTQTESSDSDDGIN